MYHVRTYTRYNTTRTYRARTRSVGDAAGTLTIRHSGALTIHGVRGFGREESGKKMAFAAQVHQIMAKSRVNNCAIDSPFEGWVALRRLFCICSNPLCWKKCDCFWMCMRKSSQNIILVRFNRVRFFFWWCKPSWDMCRRVSRHLLLARKTYLFDKSQFESSGPCIGVNARFCM